MNVPSPDVKTPQNKTSQFKTQGSGELLMQNFDEKSADSSENNLNEMLRPMKHFEKLTA